MFIHTIIAPHWFIAARNTNTPPHLAIWEPVALMPMAQDAANYALANIGDNYEIFIGSEKNEYAFDPRAEVETNLLTPDYPECI